MEGEIVNFIKFWLTVCISLCYCHRVGKLLPPGSGRLSAVAPVVALFLSLPLLLTSIHLGGPTCFFVAWLANFKLLLFAPDPPLPLRRFLAVACLPIKIHDSKNGNHSQEKSSPNRRETLNPQPKSFLNYAIKALLVALMVKLYDFSDSIHPKILLLIYSWHVYFFLEIILAVAQFLGRHLLGIELEPQFNDPYFSTSLQDFWGRRWNLTATNILQPTVYRPTVRLASRVVGRRWAPLPAVMATFMVSAMMHELIFYYLGRMMPNWEITWFFLIHGFALTVEIMVKKILPEKLRLPAVVSGPATVAFIFSTAIWLFFPQFVRLKIDEKAFEEYAALVSFVKNGAFSLVG
ncbi:acyl-CoA--sterol O-acyltransferase 1-like [Momordica charantia]|uniref:Acyl-CoA--sterol O-acyltransferase 1-like n=1 Tax=Momordica charantia TaxID=3673 RepID=A0A6J1DGN9_MOMCH|nr:acyl-CoA--sterol O-acyltransferase 1-like [Momordica charantia]